MASSCSRRSFLAGSLTAAGALVPGVGLPALRAAAEPRDRSAQAPTAPVAIQRCASYQPKPLRQAFDKAIDLIGGIKKLVENKTVAVKLNLTGTTWDPVFGLPARETYQTHPATVAALCALLADAGAKRIILLENLYWVRPFEQTLIQSGWDVKGIVSAGHHKVTFEDTRNRGAFSGYSRFKVPWGGFMFPAFDMNQRFEKTDVLISLAKLKQHATAGITGAVKNLFGNTPSAIYGDDGPGEHALSHRATMFHGGSTKPPAGAPQELTHGLPKKGPVRVPRITADIYGARPADLGIVDGIRTISGGEGHWNRGIKVLEPKLLLIGRNSVCTDAICTAAMGFDPQAEHNRFPFQGDNHLRLLASVGVGTNDPRRIEVLGVPLKDAVFPFQPGAKKAAD